MLADSFRLNRYPKLAPGYHDARLIHMAMAASQTLLVFALVLVSVFKPWGKSGVKW